MLIQSSAGYVTDCEQDRLPSHQGSVSWLAELESPSPIPATFTNRVGGLTLCVCVISQARPHATDHTVPMWPNPKNALGVPLPRSAISSVDILGQAR